MEYTTITIGRQFGSRGREIAKRLAKTLNYQYYDKELLVKVAQKSGLTTEFLENTDERQTSPFFYSLLTSPSGLWWNDQYISTEALAHQAQIETIHNLAKTRKLHHCRKMRGLYLERKEKVTANLYLRRLKRSYPAHHGKRPAFRERSSEENQRDGEITKCIL